MFYFRRVFGSIEVNFLIVLYLFTICFICCLVSFILFFVCFFNERKSCCLWKCRPLPDINSICTCISLKASFKTCKNLESASHGRGMNFSETASFYPFFIYLLFIFNLCNIYCFWSQSIFWKSNWQFLFLGQNRILLG